MKVLFALLLFVASASAFAPSSKALVRRRPPLQAELPGGLDDVVSKFQKMDPNRMRSNLMDGEFGKRGEAYFAAQAVLVVLVAIGGVPVLGDTLMMILGPALMLAGAGFVVLGGTELGDNLSPWPVPVSDSDLRTDGVFGQVRHPIYAGLLMGCAGLAILTGSAPRLLLTAMLWYVLDVKSDFEEDKLKDEFPDYEAYKKKVTGKFFPQELLDAMPWTK